jgi:hypothetical protein
MLKVGATGRGEEGKEEKKEKNDILYLMWIFILKTQLKS